MSNSTIGDTPYHFIVSIYMPEAINANNKRIAKNTLLLYFRQILIMLVSLYTSRVVLLALGVDDFGIFNVVGGVVTMFSFIMGTMSSASQRYLAYDLAGGDKVRLKQTFSLVLLTYALLAVLTIVLSEGVGVWFLNTYMNIPEGRMVAANWVLQFAILTFLAHIFSGPYLSVVIAHEQMDVYAYVSIADVVLKLLIVYLIQIFAFDRLIFYAFLIFLTSLLSTMCYVFYCHWHYQESHFRFYYDKSRLKDMTAFAWWNMIGALANVLRSQGINILLNIFFTPAVNAARGIAYQVNNAVTQFYTNFYTAVKPQIVKSYAKDELHQMHQLIFKSTKYAYFLVFVIVVPIFFYADKILRIWLKTPPELTTIFVQIILINALIEVLSMPLVSGLQAANKIKALQLTVSLLYLLNLPVSYVLLNMGMPAVTPMYVNIAIVIVSLIPRILISRKYIRISIYSYFKFVIAPMLLVTLLGGLCSYLITREFEQEEGLANVLVGCFLIVVSCLASVYFVGINQSERKLLSKFVKSKIFK